MIEICINAETESKTLYAVRAAYEGGADRVELCRAMHLDGLTPTLVCMRAARQAFEDRPGLVVMVRPRGGNFVYTRGEVQRMLQAVERAGQAGADGVALGVLRADDSRIDLPLLKMLVRVAGEAGLKVTFHRAFDATPDADQALEALVDAGVQRVLTAGIPWGMQGSAVDGLPRLRRTLERAHGRLEVVVAGGVNPGNAGMLVAGLAGVGGAFSLHAYSGAQEAGVTTRRAVERLVEKSNISYCHHPINES